MIPIIVKLIKMTDIHGNELKLDIYIEVGPSAPPIMPIDAASLKSERYFKDRYNKSICLFNTLSMVITKHTTVAIFTTFLDDLRTNYLPPLLPVLRFDACAVAVLLS